MVELFHSFGLEMLEGLLRPEAKLWDRYQSRVRGEFLEERVDELCHKFFPGAQVFRGSKWKDQKDGRDGENDVLVLLDTIALTIECKSGRIPPDARRGHPQQLPRVVKKLIEDASKQSSRFAELLLQANEVLNLSTKKGGINVIDASKVKRVIRLNVTLDYFGPLACAVRELVDSKLIDPAVATAPTLALVDHENVFHVLDTQLERLHYFARRADVERNISLFAWEEDLLACYLATGLNFGDMETDAPGRLHLGHMAAPVQRYLEAYHRGKREEKPRRRFTQWWRQILDRLQSKVFPKWTVAGFALLDVRHEDQVKFGQAAKRVIKQVKTQWHQPDHINQIIGVNGPAHRRTAVGAAVVKGVSKERRDEIVGEAVSYAVEKATSEDIVVLCLRAEQTVWPYSALAFHDPEAA